MKLKAHFFLCAGLVLLSAIGLVAGYPVEAAQSTVASKTTPTRFGDDVDFLRKHTKIIVLRDALGAAQVAVSPAWQGRVMTSTADHDSGASFGWINREFIFSNRPSPHINAYGGEDRFWLGPEGSQFSIYFAPGSPFDSAHWFVPAAFDAWPFKTVSQSRDTAVFEARFPLTNYSGTHFQVMVKREIRLLDGKTAWRNLDLEPPGHIAVVAYESNNTLTNVGRSPWKKESGLLSIWILGMFNPSPSATIVVPIKPGPSSQLGVSVLAYEAYGVILPHQLKETTNAVFFRGDGKSRGKIGINPKRTVGKLGSYDAQRHVLTLVQFNQPLDVDEYVNSSWGPQEKPYGGDAVNSYNDGPLTPDARPLGPFYELESSSPAVALAPGASLEHTHRTFHLTGPEKELDVLARKVLGVSLAEIETALPTE
jgi:hypothetical protein